MKIYKPTNLHKTSGRQFPDCPLTVFDDRFTAVVAAWFIVMYKSMDAAFGFNC